MTNRVLLTGAGFTSNFGAPLASEMSDIIFNNSAIQKNKLLREKLQLNFDYESIYHEVMSEKKYTDPEKKIFQKAVERAYIEADDRIINSSIRWQTYPRLYDGLILQFSSKMKGSGYIFTLNQDLFLERRFQTLNSISSQLEIPIIGTRMLTALNRLFNSDDIRVLPNDQDYESEKQRYLNRAQRGEVNLSYVKLHGSQDWRKPIDKEEPFMIIGYNKEKGIATEPLLKWYSEIFEQQLDREDTKLLIIGYGFNDAHINKMIAEAKDLRIYIINPFSRKAFITELTQKPYGMRLSTLISGYYQRTIVELFPDDLTIETHADWDNIKEQFFDMQRNEPYFRSI